MDDNSTDNVFLNCPFDAAYRELLWATTYTVFDCGFVPRCALEENDSGDVRYEKIVRLMRQCRFGIHDISRIQLDSDGYPRFNMPFELGLFLGMKRSGNETQRRKRALVLDTEQYRYQQFLSDLAGADIECHQDNCDQLIDKVRGWLRDASQRKLIPGSALIRQRYVAFRNIWLPPTLEELAIDTTGLSWIEFRDLSFEWVSGNPL